MRQTGKTIHAAGLKERPPSACRNAFRLITYVCIKDSTIVEKADKETFVITEGNGTQRVLYTV